MFEGLLDCRKAMHCDRVRLFERKYCFGLMVQPDIKNLFVNSRKLDLSHSTVRGRLFSLLLTSLVA